MMESRITWIISILFHPLFITLYGLIILFHSGLYISFLPQNLKKWIYIIVAVNTAVIPLSLTPFYLYRKIIKSIKMSNAQERIIPLIVNTFLFYITYYLLTRYNVPDVIRVYILAGAVTLFIALLISWKWKISLHMLGIGALTGVIFSVSLRYNIDFNLYLIILILVSGLVGYARLRMNDHNSKQVYVSYLLGVIIAGVLLYYL